MFNKNSNSILPDIVFSMTKVSTFEWQYCAFGNSTLKERVFSFSPFPPTIHKYINRLNESRKMTFVLAFSSDGDPVESETQRLRCNSLLSILPVQDVKLQTSRSLISTLWLTTCIETVDGTVNHLIDRQSNLCANVTGQVYCLMLRQRMSSCCLV